MKNRRPPCTNLARVALLLVTFLGAAVPVAAQQKIRIPEVRGDQLLFFYDARPGRTSFLLVSNPADAAVSLDVAFYPLSLAGRLGSETLELEPGGNTVIDPARSAGGAAAGSAGLAVVTPITGGGDPTPVVPPEPLTGGFTLANTSLASAFGENAFARFAVATSGTRATAGSPVTGSPLRYQRLAPEVLTVPLYFDPRSLGPVEDDGNRVLLAAFEDRYGVGFDLAPAALDTEATFLGSSGTLLARRTLSFAGVLLSDLQSVAGRDTALAGSGKVFFDLHGAPANVFGIFSQSLGTFASGQRMPAADRVPAGTTGGPRGGCSTALATASVDWDRTAFPDVSGVIVRIHYPAQVTIPGSDASPGIRERITNLTGIEDGLFEAADRPQSGAGADDQLSVALLSLSQSFVPGPLVRVRFDCVPGTQAPGASALSCAVEAARFDGSLVSPASCALTVEIQE